MTRPKNSERVKAEARIQEAIKAMKNDKKYTLCQAARDFNIPRSTLQHRVNGTKPRNKAQEDRMNLTHNEESELAQWITTLTGRDYAPRYNTVRELAEIIRNRRVKGINDESIQLVNYEPFGRDWVARFLSRHPHLESARRKLIDAARIKDVSVERLTKWFEDLKKVIETENIEPENIYNMDESGFAIGDVEASQRIIDVEIPQKFQAKPGRQEWVTVVASICADGNSLPPLIIFKGENLSRQWIPADIPNDWRFGCNTKGWTSINRGSQWLREVFEPLTREKANGKPRLLICDGHDSHITASWIAHCMENNIIFMVLPPHSSHLTQPLDVGVFGPLKTLMASAIEPLIGIEIHQIMKAEWLAAYVKAHNNAFSKRNIQSGFCGTGIFPYNPSKVVDRIKPIVPSTVVVRDSTPTESTTPFKESVLTSSPLNTDEARLANAALLNELASGAQLSTPTRNYAQKVVKRSERLQVRNIIIEEQHAKLTTAVTTRKTILSGKRKVIDGEHILTTSEILHKLQKAEKITKKRKTTGIKKGKKWEREVVDELSDESVAGQDESSVIQDCIAVRLLNH